MRIRSITDILNASIDFPGGDTIAAVTIEYGARP
jgi:hypothetical protein